MRVVGLGIGFFCVASVFAQAQTPPWLWLLAVFHGFLWPHVAYRAALSWSVPFHGERFNLMIDAAFGGFWLIAMRFNLLPSVLLLTMLSMDNIAAGGIRLFLRGLAAHALGAAIGVAVLGIAFAPHTQMATIIACLPLLVLYPLTLGWVSFRMSQKLSNHARELERLSQTDGLTGLLNRRHWEDRLAEQFARCRDNNEPCCLLLLDLDHFKHVNDTEGHAAGDAALRSFALFLRANLRPHDVIGRYGGEEFGVILPGLACVEAQVVVDLLICNLRERAGQAHAHRQANGHTHGALRCTASAGLAPYWRALDGAGAWLLETDRCLYAAKAKGRDCVVVSTMPGAQTEPGASVPPASGWPGTLASPDGVAASV